MMNIKLAIWIYDDEGASELSVQSASATISSKLPASFNTVVNTLSSQDILDNKLESNSADIGILIMPGGADLPYCQKLNGRGNELIAKFISSGNIYIGICAGGYYGARDIQFSGQSFEKGSKKLRRKVYEKQYKQRYEINGPRELAFFSGTAIGSIARLTDGQLYDESVASKAMVTLDYANSQQDEVYYHGGAYFKSGSNDADDVSDISAGFEVLATYSDGKNAVITGDNGQGKYLLSGVHFELCPKIYQKLTVAKASQDNTHKEQLLLAAINNESYGSLIYDEIISMIEAIYSSKQRQTLDN